MNVIVFASRKGGTGKSTLAAHLAAHVHKATKPCLLIDADPQGENRFATLGGPQHTRNIGSLNFQSRTHGLLGVIREFLVILE